MVSYFCCCLFVSFLLSFYHLTLVNNAHIDTNIHTHGLHVSGVGTVDDVTRVAEPGKCLTYEVRLFVCLFIGSNNNSSKLEED